MYITHDYNNTCTHTEIQIYVHIMSVTNIRSVQIFTFLFLYPNVLLVSRYSFNVCKCPEI